MLTCFEKKKVHKSVPIYIVAEADYSDWLADCSLQVKSWLENISFTAHAGHHCLLPDASGHFHAVLISIKDDDDVWQLGSLPMKLPQGQYHFETNLEGHSLYQAVLAWGLGAYQFTQYKKAKREPARLVLPAACNADLLENIVESIYLTRDLINTPPEDMGPLELAEATFELGKHHHATVTQVVAEELLDEMYPAIYTVGRASYNSPRLIDLRWGNPHAPKLTLVGKGVCFDTGGLNMKSTSGMSLMKKDMGGAAHVLGLARMVMQANLPVCLRVLIPAVENSISAEAYHPSDVITMRNGKTVEVTNTDAEGRLVLADALVEASSEKPDLLIDFATLTGAAKVATGADLPAMFTNSDVLANSIAGFGQQNSDPVWRLPLHKPYFSLLESDIADFTNCGNTPYAGAITAALFLEQFVGEGIPWLHFDVMAWNVSNRPARPKGGEAVALRAVFDYLRQRFSAQH